jgi:hypothetical protein
VAAVGMSHRRYSVELVSRATTNSWSYKVFLGPFGSPKLERAVSVLIKPALLLLVSHKAGLNDFWPEETPLQRLSFATPLTLTQHPINQHTTPHSNATLLS